MSTNIRNQIFRKQFFQKTFSKVAYDKKAIIIDFHSELKISLKSLQKNVACNKFKI